MTTPPKFEFEDGTPATPASSAKPAQGDAPVAFNPFADQKVDLAPKPMAPAPAAAPAAAPSGGVAPEPVAPIGTPGSVADDAGAGRDLWNCPHCGSGNQKKRTTCRACGKDPLEPVKLPWFRTVPGMAGIAGAVLLLIVVMLLGSRTDKSLHAPGPKRVDGAARTWGKLAGDVEEDLGDKRGFTRRGMLSVSGRVAGAKSLPGYPWITTVVLVLGDAAKDDFQARNWGTVITEREVSSTASDFVVLHCLFDEKPNLVRGTWLSLKGPTGFVSLEGKLVNATQGRGHYTVKVEESLMESAEGKP